MNRIRHELKEGNEGNMCSVEEFEKMLKNASGSGDGETEKFLNVEPKILEQIKNKYVKRGTKMIDYNKALKILGILYKTGYNPTSSRGKVPKATSKINLIAVDNSENAHYYNYSPDSKL